jgi:hypothetical protein
LTLVGGLPSRREAAKIIFIALMVVVFSGTMIFSLVNGNESSIASYVYAKCPGIPYGSTSGGPDYIDISIDVGLVAVFGYFLYLTIRDMRRKAKEKTITK